MQITRHFVDISQKQLLRQRVKFEFSIYRSQVCIRESVCVCVCVAKRFLFEYISLNLWPDVHRCSGTYT